MGSTGLLSLPRDVLVQLPKYLHTLEDYKELSSTCRTLRDILAAALPNDILRLAAAQSNVFFRPSPHFLVCATARELGNWARQSDANEAELARRMQDGVEGLLALALDEANCGLTMARIRELHLRRFSIVNPVTDLIDRCVGGQWYATPDFWNGGVDDAYTIDADPPENFFHLATYGELFAPDLDAILRQDRAARRLRIDTRLEYVKYCVPDQYAFCDTSPDPRRNVQMTGPYAPNEHGRPAWYPTHNLALTWCTKSSRWRPHWKRVRERAGPDFQSDFRDGWWYSAHHHRSQDWRQRLWENTMVCQGFDGLGMIRDEFIDDWVPKVKEWREQIAKLEEEPPMTMVGRQATLEYPYLLGDLRIMMSGYCPGT